MKFLEKFNHNLNKFFAIIFIIIALIYDINPVDFIPDIAPFIGWFDDIVITLISIINAYINLRKKIWNIVF